MVSASDNVTSVAFATSNSDATVVVRGSLSSGPDEYGTKTASNLAGTKRFEVEIETHHKAPSTSRVLKRRFKFLAAEWKKERDPYSSVPERWAMCTSYQKIIAMGPAAIPLILKQLRVEPDHWFWALSVLSDANPVLQEHEGQFNEMVNDWLGWGVRNGFISPKD